ncbi:MAG: 2OG-Fe dioxygenase family protein [Rubrivivax sp.]|nr:2OG-Fe dioxygenase family protein [Rubrivivax sp.]
MSLFAPGTPEQRLRQAGYSVLEAADVARRAEVSVSELAGLAPFWGDLPPDAHLRDGGRYRRRRHASYLVMPTGEVQAVPHRAHWQPQEYNALHGGLERWFEPLDPAMARAPGFIGLLRAFAPLAELIQPGTPCWFVESHPFRIDCTGGIGRPTPEGAHRDGVDLVVVLLVERHAIRGGETRVFEAQGPNGVRFTLQEPWSALVLDDARVIHESTPIQPAKADGAGWRDTLVLTYRRHGFQDPPAQPG